MVALQEPVDIMSTSAEHGKVQWTPTRAVCNSINFRLLDGPNNDSATRSTNAKFFNTLSADHALSMLDHPIVRIAPDPARPLFVPASALRLALARTLPLHAGPFPLTWPLTWPFPLVPTDNVPRCPSLPNIIQQLSLKLPPAFRCPARPQQPQTSFVLNDAELASLIARCVGHEGAFTWR